MRLSTCNLQLATWQHGKNWQAVKVAVAWRTNKAGKGETFWCSLRHWDRVPIDASRRGGGGVAWGRQRRDAFSSLLCVKFSWRWPNLLPDFSFSFAAISRRVSLPASWLPSIVSFKWHVACGKLAGMSTEWMCPRSACWCSTFMSAHWKISVFSCFKIKSIIAKINYAPHAERSWQGGGAGEAWQLFSGSAGQLQLVEQDVDTKTPGWLLTAVSCSYTRNASITRLVSTLTLCSFACGDQDEVHTSVEGVVERCLAWHWPQITQNERVPNVRIAPVVFSYCRCRCCCCNWHDLQKARTHVGHVAHSVIETGRGRRRGRGTQCTTRF